MQLKQLAHNFYTLPEDHQVAETIAHHYRWYSSRFSPRDIPRFADVSSLTQSPQTMKAIRDFFVARYKAMGANGPTHILGFDARGFLFGPMIAVELGLPFVLMRKAEKNAGLLIKSEPYDKQYKEAAPQVMTIRCGSIGKGARVVLIDDVLATGGTALSGLQLVEASGATIVQFICVLALAFLKGVEKIHQTADGRYRQIPFLSLITDTMLTEKNCGDVIGYSGPRVLSCSDLHESNGQLDTLCNNSSNDNASHDDKIK